MEGQTTLAPILRQIRQDDEAQSTSHNQKDRDEIGEGICHIARQASEIPENIKPCIIKQGYRMPDTKIQGLPQGHVKRPPDGEQHSAHRLDRQ
ncbi:hypothetical protein D1872_267570 [compost metagenome]